MLSKEKCFSDTYFKFRINTMKVNLQVFTERINKSVDALLEISDESAAIKKSVNKWSRKEILGHLIDSANVNYNRFINAVSKEDLIFGTYPQNEWVELQSYNSRDWRQLIFLWKSLNVHIIELVKNIPEEKLFRLTTSHNFNNICWKEVQEGEKSSLDYLINDYFGHLEHHLKQILNY